MGREDNILFVIEAKKGDIFIPQTLASIQTIAQQSWLIPNSKRVDYVNNYLCPVVDGDDATQFLLKYREARSRNNMSAEQAINHTVINSSGTLVSTSLVLSAVSAGAVDESQSLADCNSSAGSGLKKA